MFKAAFKDFGYNISAHFAQLHVNGEQTDCDIVCMADGTKIPCHRQVLSLSPPFKEMLERKSVCSVLQAFQKRAELKIRGHPAATLKLVVKFIYYGHFVTDDEHQIYQVLNFAHEHKEEKLIVSGTKEWQQSANEI